jgi:Protein HRI1
MPTAFISHRLSIRWLPGVASEPTNTVVLTGASTGVFLDVRFLKDSKKLDWAFAGYRYTDPSFVLECLDEIYLLSSELSSLRCTGRHQVQTSYRFEFQDTGTITSAIGKKTEYM